MKWMGMAPGRVNEIDRPIGYVVAHHRPRQNRETKLDPHAILNIATETVNALRTTDGKAIDILQTRIFRRPAAIDVLRAGHESKTSSIAAAPPFSSVIAATGPSPIAASPPLCSAIAAQAPSSIAASPPCSSVIAAPAP